MKETKGKIVIAIILTVVMLIASVKSSMAYADNLNMDEDRVIIRPSFIWNGTGTITISSSVKDYKLYYQSVDMSDEQYETCVNLKEKYKLEDLENELDEAEKKYNNATTPEDKKTYGEKYNDLVEKYNSKITEYNSELKTNIPDFKEDNWKESADGKVEATSNKAKGFAVWAKLVKSDGTILYKVNIYGNDQKNNDNDEKKDVITLDKTTLTLEEGNSATLTATINSTDITDKTVTWKSEDEKIAKVENGKVTAISEGTTKIIATASDGSTATCTVTVKKVANTNEGKSNDPTTSKKPLAQTGEKTYIVVGILAIVSAFGLYRFKKVKNLKLK